MPIPAETIHAWNHAHAGLALSPAREAKLPTELDQLAAARPGLTFDAEPAGFRAALLAAVSPAAEPAA